MIFFSQIALTRIIVEGFTGINVVGILRPNFFKVSELKDFETLGELIEKIETLVVKLKIATNFRGVNNNFPLHFFIFFNIESFIVFQPR